MTNGDVNTTGAEDHNPWRHGNPFCVVVIGYEGIVTSPSINGKSSVNPDLLGPTCRPYTDWRRTVNQS